MNVDWFQKSRLWLITDHETCIPLTIPQLLRQAIPAGIDVVVFRMKDATGDDFISTAAESLDVCNEYEVPMIISHELETAINMNSAGIHLGSQGPKIDDVRRQVSAEMLVGYSTHSISEARERLTAGCDYVFLGPIFASPRKLQYGKPLGSKVIQQAADINDRIVYIGGIDRTTITESIACGAQRVAAIRAFQESQHFRESTEMLQGAFRNSSSNSC